MPTFLPYHYFRRINHPQYNRGNPPNYDFQLIQLSSAVNFADSRLSHVYPACWPTSEPTSGRVCLPKNLSQMLQENFSSTRLSFLAGEQLHQVADSQMYCRRQMLMLSQEEHATIYHHTEAESQIRWFVWGFWQGELTLARCVCYKT